MKRTQTILVLLALALTVAVVFAGCALFSGGSGGGGGTSKAPPDDRDTSWYDGKSKETTFYIANAKQLMGLAKLSNLAKNPVDFQGKTIELTANIDLSEEKWRPISGFSGTFDGKGFSISNLSISDYSNAALFGTASMATIKNLTVNVQKIETKKTSSNNAGGLVAYATGITIENCGVNIKDSITAYADKANLAFAGGLAGAIDGVPMFPSIINNCYVSGNVSSVASANGSACSGGLVGMAGLALMKAQINITNSYVMGNIFASSGDSNSFAGGFIGSGGIFGADIKNSYVNAAVSAAVGDAKGGKNEAFFSGSFGRWGGGTNTAVYYNSTKVANQKINSGTKDGSMPAGITALTDANMKKQASFKDFDFTSVWAIENATNSGYPYLRWQKK